MRLGICVCVFVIKLGYIGLSLAHAADAKTDVENIIAVVNNEKILERDIEAIIKDLRKTGTVVDKLARQRLIDRLIEQKMIAQYAQKIGYQDNPNVQKRIQIMSEMVLRDTYLSDIISKKINDKNIKQAFDKKMAEYEPEFEYNASHILVKNFQDAQMIKHKIDKGADFAQMVLKHSMDQETNSAGDLGFFSEEMMGATFTQVANKLEIGEVSEPVRTSFGWHIVKLIAKRQLPVPTFEQLKPSIENELSQEVIENHIAKLKKDANIQLFNKDNSDI